MRPAPPPRPTAADTPLYADLVVLGAIGFMVFIAYHLPLAGLAYDDHHVLPERAAMADNTDWLMHLLSLDQTRLVNTLPHTLLFRPGFFFIYWLGDVLARPDRTLLTLAAVANYAVAAGTLYLTLRRWCGVLLAFALCTLFVYPNQGYVLAGTWHVTFYLLAVILYVAGFAMMDRAAGPSDAPAASSGPRRSLGPATLVLFLSTLFNEFAVVAIAASAVTLWLIGRCHHTAAARTLRMARSAVIAAGGYVVLWIINWTHYAPPLLLTPDAAAGGVKNFAGNFLGFLEHAGMFLWPARQLYAPPGGGVPMGRPLPPGDPRIVLVVLALAALYAGLAAILRAPRGDALATDVALVSASLALIVVLSVGRVATLGAVADWSYPLLGFFLVALVGRALGASLRRRGALPAIILGTIVAALVLTAVARGQLLAAVHRDIYQDVTPQLRVVSAVAAFFEQKPGRCHAGLEMHYDSEGKDLAFNAPRWIMTQSFPFSLADVETELQLFACGIRPGRPIYPLIEADRDLTRIQITFRELMLARETWTRVPAEEGDLGSEPFDQGRAPNAFEVAAGRPVDNRLRVAARTRAPVSLDALRISFRSRARGRVLYDFGIRFRDTETAPRFIGFVDNVVLASDGPLRFANVRYAGYARGSWTRWAPVLPARGTVTFRRDGTECLVFLNQYLLGALSCSPGQAASVDFLQWPNGTPGTSLESIARAHAAWRLHWVTAGRTVLANQDADPGSQQGGGP